MNGIFNEVRSKIIMKLQSISYKGDISDLGNEIGIIIGKYNKENVRDFKFGLNHGISLSDGTH